MRQSTTRTWFLGVAVFIVLATGLVTIAQTPTPGGGAQPPAAQAPFIQTSPESGGVGATSRWAVAVLGFLLLARNRRMISCAMRP